MYKRQAEKYPAGDVTPGTVPGGTVPAGVYTPSFRVQLPDGRIIPVSYTHLGFDLLLEQKVAIKEYFPMSTGMVSRENRSMVVWSNAMMGTVSYTHLLSFGGTRGVPAVFWNHYSKIISPLDTIVY